MDFVARAGHVVDRWQRVAGILLIIALVEAWMVLSYMSTNKQLLLDYKRIREEAKVYVVPGSAAGYYTPTKPEFLLEELAYLVVNSLNTYTYENLEVQYKEIRKFFNEDMLAASHAHFSKLINDIHNDERSALFIPYRNSYKVEQVREPDIRGTVYDVIIDGSVQYIISDAVVEAIPIRFVMRFKRKFISPANPFGFELMTYTQTELRGRS